VVSIIWNYTGLSAQQMGARITSVSERSLTTTGQRHRATSNRRPRPGIAIIKVYLQPNANIATAIASGRVSISQAQLRGLPPGITPPLIIKYTASSVPVIQLGLSAPSLSESQLFDLTLNFLRPRLGDDPPEPRCPIRMGGRQRVIAVDLDTEALQAKGLTPADIVNAVNAQNLILPAGTTKIGATEYNVDLNGSPDSIGRPERYPRAHDQRRDDLPARSGPRARRLPGPDQRGAGKTACAGFWSRS